MLRSDDPQYQADLAALASEGIGEGDFDDEGHAVPTDLVELYEVLEAGKAGL